MTIKLIDRPNGPQWICRQCGKPKLLACQDSADPHHAWIVCDEMLGCKAKTWFALLPDGRWVTVGGVK